MTHGDRTLIEGLRARAIEAASVVTEVASWEAVAALAVGVAGDGRVALARSLLAAHPEVGRGLEDRMLLPDDDDPFASVADVAVGVVEGVLAVAETGSVLLSQAGLAERAVGALSRTCLHVVERGRVVADLEGAAVWLDQHAASVSLATLVTGPSRTADIERSLTIGVQGPSEVHVVIVG